MTRGRRTPARAFAIIIIAGTLACESAPAPVEEPAPVSVRSVSVVEVEAADRLEAGGTVAAGRTATISSRIVAPVLELRARAGDRVRAGQVLVVLDGRDSAAHAEQAAAVFASHEQALAAARTDLAAAESEHTLASAWHSRIAALHEKSSATRHELDEAQTRLATARARLDGASARLQQAGSTVSAARAASAAASTVRGFSTLAAPFEAIVTETYTDPGNLAAPGVPLLRLESIGARQVHATVEEARVGFISPGQPVDVQMQTAGAGTTPLLAGRVVEVAREIAAGARAFTIKVSLPADVDARTGTFARVFFSGPARRRLVVPAAAVVRHGQVASVFVEGGGRVRMRVLHLGEPVSDGIEVLAGLEAGERVVLAPPAGLRDGSPVKAGAAPSGAER
jgi:RND family efflux transporter MFP subunit